MAEHTPDNLTRAVAFFQHPDRIRLLEALYTKYIALGRIGGQVALPNSTHAERQEIASLLNKPLSHQPTITIRLTDIENALATSSFACTLPELLQAAYPHRSHLTRPQQRERISQSQHHFHSNLLALAQQHTNTPAAQWLTQGEHGLETYFRRYKNASHTEQTTLLHTLNLVAQALNNLPEKLHYERLALFAERITGDPHFFDLSTLGGRILFYALSDLQNLQHSIPTNLPTSSSHTSTSPDLSSSSNDFATDQPLTPNAQRHLLFYDAGLLLDTISSTVTIANLASATTSLSTPDPLIAASDGHILILPLRQLLTWEQVHSTTQHIYIVENPQVFENLVDRLSATTPPSNSTAPTFTSPTLICTSGWPSVAAIRLLNLLVESQPNCTLHYSGDFDLQGLRIAAHLYNRYPHKLTLWHYDAPTYLTAIHHHSQDLTPQEHAALSTLPPPFTELTLSMQHINKKAYQESINNLLFSDLISNPNT